MREWISAATLAAALAVLPAAPTSAQNAEPGKGGRKPPTPASAATITITVTNSRKADLVQLQAAESGSVSWTRVLGALKAGKQAPARLPRSYDCRVNLHGTFADGQSMDATDVDVCAQNTLNLTD